MTLVEPTREVDAAAVGRALDRAAAGERVDVDDAETLLAASGAQLEQLLEVAGRMRDVGNAASGRPGVITYSRKVFIPLTTLCRDRCHYCVFVDTPGQLFAARKPVYMTAEQVLAVARQGAALGCKEALLTLGDRPEDRWPAAREWLDAHGYASTLDYVGAMARLITAETGLLAHLNPGVMSHDELVALRPTAPSMGMMLETTSRALYEEPGQVHYGSPDKDPALRLQVIDDAGRARVPFTTGILVGIGETLRDRAESLIALRDAHERHAHVQEVIVQNFRAKPRTAAQSAPDASLLEYVAAVAVARLVMGPLMRIQVPPNLSDPAEFDLLVRAGADDWGGVSPLTADHVNPERPWPHLDDLTARTAELGFTLRERLTAHPQYLVDEWLDPAMRGPVAALADPVTGLAADVLPVAAARVASRSVDSRPMGFRPVAEQSATPPTVQDSVRMARAAEEPPEFRGSAPFPTTGVLNPEPDAAGTRPPEARRLRSTDGAKGVGRLTEAAASDPLALDDAAWVRLLEATGEGLDALTEAADNARRYTVGEAIGIAVNRNLTSSGLRTDPTGEPGTFTLGDVAAIAADAADLGATELCVQGLLPPTEDPRGYLAIARTVKAAAPQLHLHAFRPQDVWDLADRGGLGLAGAIEALRDAGVDTFPGTGVKILSERVRALVAPGDLETDRWIEAVTAAHATGLRSTSVLFYGHVESAAERIAHLRLLREIQDASPRRAGFTEFVPIPLPGPAGGVALVPGRAAIDEHRAMVAVSRLLLSGSIPHVQIPWTRVGLDAAAVLLRSGGDDLGGTLLDGRVRPDAGIEHGLELPLPDAARLAGRLFRPFRQRTTDYREPTAKTVARPAAAPVTERA